MGRKKGTGFGNSLLNKLDKSSPVKEAEKAEHLKTAFEVSWAEDETNKMQLESTHEKSFNSYLLNKNCLRELDTVFT